MASSLQQLNSFSVNNQANSVAKDYDDAKVEWWWRPFGLSCSMVVALLVVIGVVFTVIPRSQPAPSPAPTSPQVKDNVITIIHFNDVYRLASTKSGGLWKGGVAKATTLIKEARALNPGRTFTTFAGDLISPSATSDLFDGQQMINIFNQLEVDAASLGNHEFDYGWATLESRLADSTFPWLNSNILNATTDVPIHHTIRQVEKIVAAATEPTRAATKVCFFGVAYDIRDSIVSDKDKYKHANTIDASKQEVKSLKEAGCKVIVALTHQFNDLDCELSRALKGDFEVDLIVGGHDHQAILTTNCGPAPYIKADSDLHSLWVVDLHLDSAGKVSYVTMDFKKSMGTTPEDPDIKAAVAVWEKEADLRLGVKAGCSLVDLSTVANVIRTQEMPLGNLFADTMRTLGVGAATYTVDFAAQNGGGLRANRIFPKGDFTKLDLTNIHPFGNTVVTCYVDGASLKGFISDSLDCYQDFCGDFNQVSGFKYSFDPTKAQGERLVSIEQADGSPILDNTTYTLAIPDYVYGYTDRLNTKPLYNMVSTNDAQLLIKEVMETFAAAGEACVNPQVEGRVINVAVAAAEAAALAASSTAIV